MGLMPASYKVTARSVSRVLSDGRRQSDRSLKGHAAGVRKGQPWAVNHHPGIVAVYELGRGPLGGSPRATALPRAVPGYDRQADIRGAKGGYHRLYAGRGWWAVVSQSRRLVQPLWPLQPPLIEPCVRFSLTRLSDDVHVATVAALP